MDTEQLVRKSKFPFNIKIQNSLGSSSCEIGICLWSSLMILKGAKHRIRSDDMTMPCELLERCGFICDTNLWNAISPKLKNIHFLGALREGIILQRKKSVTIVTMKGRCYKALTELLFCVCCPKQLVCCGPRDARHEMPSSKTILAWLMDTGLRLLPRVHHRIPEVRHAAITSSEMKSRLSNSCSNTQGTNTSAQKTCGQNCLKGFARQMRGQSFTLNCTRSWAKHAHTYSCIPISICPWTLMAKWEYNAMGGKD